jgi:hypothetical protein
MRAGMAGRPRRVDDQLRARGLALLQAEADVEQLGAVERVEEELRGLEIRCGEVQVCGEAACVASAQLAQRGAALKDDAELERALVVEVLERVVLGDVEQSGVAHAAATLEVAREIALRNHRRGSSES